jgi:hemin uptake protein HemP
MDETEQRRIGKPPRSGRDGPPQPAERSDDPEPPASPRVVKAQDLFGEQREVLIDLDGIRYRLRITRRNKLILQK